jgi:hypothetical protein
MSRRRVLRPGRRALRLGNVDLDLKLDELLLRLRENPKRQPWICRVAPDKIKIVVPPIEVEYEVRERLCSGIKFRTTNYQDLQSYSI